MKTKWWLILIFVLVIGCFIALSVQKLVTPNELSKVEMTEQVERVYSGKVQSLVQKKEQFIANFEKDGTVYEVALNPITGQFTNLQLVKKNEHVVKKDETTTPTDEIELSTDSITLNAQIDEQSAIDIALKEVTGELENVDFENTSDGGHYFIEIEQQDGDVIIQIHAVTGKILSIQYED